MDIGENRRDGKMRILYLMLMLIIPSLGFAQLDSNTYSYQTPGVKLRYYSPAAKDTLETGNVNRLVLKGDYVLTHAGKFKVNQLSSMSIPTGKGKFSSGILPGIVGGAVVGLIIGSMLDVDDEFNHGGYFFNIKYAIVTIPVGIVLGAITGGIISTQINTYTNHDFPGSNAEFKKIELKSLMEKWRKR